MTLKEFLRARLDEDERAARRAKAFKYDRPTDAPWERARLAVEQGMGLSSDEHIARRDPARTLREVEAKRRIVVLYEEVERNTGTLTAREDRRDARIERVALANVIRLLAAAYADHPDYDEAWRL